MTSSNLALFQLHEEDAGLRRQAAIAKCKAMDRPDPYQERAREMAREETPGMVRREGSRVSRRHVLASPASPPQRSSLRQLSSATDGIS